MNIHYLAVATIAALLTTANTATQPASSPRPQADAAAPGSAQRKTRAVVVRVQRLTTIGTRAIVVRRPAGQVSQDFILVSASTSAADLARAVATLMFSRHTQGASVHREMRAEISAAPVNNQQKTADLQRAARDLARLPRAHAVNIKGVGHGPAIAIAVTAAPAKRKG